MKRIGILDNTEGTFSRLYLKENTIVDQEGKVFKAKDIKESIKLTPFGVSTFKTLLEKEEELPEEDLPVEGELPVEDSVDELPTEETEEEIEEEKEEDLEDTIKDEIEEPFYAIDERFEIGRAHV